MERVTQNDPSDPRAGRPHVVVVGGGIAGLVAARDLLAGGVRVTLLEASDHLGGKVRPHTVGGIELDAGAESFATRAGTVAALVSEVGLGYALVSPAAAGAWLQPATGPALPLPEAGLLGIPSVPLASDVIAIVGLPGALRAQLDSLMSGFVGSKERSLGRLVRKRMGRAVLDRLVAPVAGAIHSRHPDDLDVDTVAPRLREAVLSESTLARAVQVTRAAAPAGAAVQGLHGGVFLLVDALAAQVTGSVDVRLESPVQSVTGGSVTLADGETLAADHVVIAAPVDATAGPAITLVTLVVREARLDAAPRGTGVLVAPGARGVGAKALTHASAKWAWLKKRAGDAHVLRLSYDGDAASDPDLERRALADAAVLLGVDLTPEQLVASARQDWTGPPSPPAGSIPGTTRVGEQVTGAGLAGVITHSRQAAAAILRDLDDRADYA